MNQGGMEKGNIGFLTSNWVRVAANILHQPLTEAAKAFLPPPGELQKADRDWKEERTTRMFHMKVCMLQTPSGGCKQLLVGRRG